MSIQVSWDDDSKYAVRMAFEAEWLVEDLQHAVDQTDKLIASAAHQVDIIIDITSGMKIPKDFMSIAQSLLENPNPRPNEGQRVVVGANGMIKFLYNGVQKAFASKLGERKLLFEDDLESARETLMNLRMENPQ